MNPREEQLRRESLGLPIEPASADAGSAAARREHAALVRVYEAFDRDHETLKQELLALLPDASPPQAVQSAYAPGRLGEFVMRSLRKHKLAAVLMPAACLAVIAFVVINGTSRSAFAKVVERLREIETARCRVVLKTHGADGNPLAPDSTGEFILTNQHGSRQDLYAGSELITSTYMLPDGAIVTIIPATNTIQRLEPNQANASASGNMLQNWLNMLQRSGGVADRELGTMLIEGRQCVGFELSGARFGIPAGKDGTRATFEVWAEPGSNLPVMMELRAPMPNLGGTVIAQYKEFEWNPPIDPAALTPPPADGMNAISLAMPELSEKVLIDALRDYAAVTGEYPADLDPGKTAASFIAKLMKSGQLPDPSSKEFQQQLSERAMVIGAGAGYFQGLYAQNLDPRYVGESVKPGDASAEIASWNAADGGRRVIYGDLRVETVLEK